MNITLLAKNLKMGIKGLKPFLKKLAPYAFSRCPLSYFRGKRIAVDISGLMYKFKSVCQNSEIDRTNVIFKDLDTEKIFNNWFGMFIQQCTNFLEAGVTPVYVFDGKPFLEKGDELQRRGEVRENKMNEIRNELQKIRISGEGEFTPLEIKQMLEQTDSRVSSLMKQVVNLPMSEKMKLKKIFDEIGLPTVQSKYEAEKTCSMLALDGLVDAVFSADTDTLAYGPTLVITDIKKESYDDVYCDVCTYIYHPYILWSLGISQEQFIDICILCGTDYNKNIPGIGPVKSHAGIQDYGNIEEFIKRLNVTEEDVSSLKFPKCRELYRRCRSSESAEGDINLTFNFIKIEKNAKSILESRNRSSDYFTRLIMEMKKPLKFTESSVIQPTP